MRADVRFEELLPLPTHCPVLGIPLDYSATKTGSPEGNRASIDRIDNSKGYEPGNVWVISHRANTLKSNATLEELEKLVHALKVREVLS